MKKIGKYLYSDEEGNLLLIANPDAMIRINVEETTETGIIQEDKETKMNEIIKTTKQEITQESKRSKIEQAKEILRQINELEGVLTDLYLQLNEIEG